MCCSTACCDPDAAFSTFVAARCGSQRSSPTGVVGRVLEICTHLARRHDFRGRAPGMVARLGRRLVQIRKRQDWLLGGGRYACGAVATRRSCAHTHTRAGFPSVPDLGTGGVAGQITRSGRSRTRVGGTMRNSPASANRNATSLPPSLSSPTVTWYTCRRTRSHLHVGLFARARVCVCVCV